MSQKPTVNRSGVDILFPRSRMSESAKSPVDEKTNAGIRQESEGREIRKAESQNVGIPTTQTAAGKEKEAFYLLPETLDAIEALRRRLRREYGLSRRATSKSAIVDAAIGALSRNPDMLAAWLRDFR